MQRASKNSRPGSRLEGILAPLLVRELEESRYEVVAGARRLRAAKLAELERLPVRVVKLTDAEAIEAQCVENLQREDIHPLEEALGFKSLLELGEPAYSIATIASRAGKSEAYVYGRIRLADLIPPVAEAFLKDQITIGHALLIAKLPASQQQEAFSAAFRGLWTSEGNSQVLIPVREMALCGALHRVCWAGGWGGGRRGCVGPRGAGGVVVVRGWRGGGGGGGWGGWCGGGVGGVGWVVGVGRSGAGWGVCGGVWCVGVGGGGCAGGGGGG